MISLMTKSCFGVGNSWRLFMLVWRFHSITAFKKGMNMYVYNMTVTSPMGMSYDEDKMQIELRKPKADKVQTASRSSTLKLSMTNLLQPILLQPPKTNKSIRSGPKIISLENQVGTPCLGTGYLSLYTHHLGTFYVINVLILPIVHRHLTNQAPHQQ